MQSEKAVFGGGSLLGLAAQGMGRPSEPDICVICVTCTFQKQFLFQRIERGGDLPRIQQWQGFDTLLRVSIWHFQVSMGAAFLPTRVDNGLTSRAIRGDFTRVSGFSKQISRVLTQVDVRAQLLSGWACEAQEPPQNHKNCRKFPIH